MLITGIAVVLMNLNPLIKLDGYYLLGELVGIPTIKESSTEYVTNWVKRIFFRLPVDVPYLSARRRWFFVIYAVLSGMYSYILLFAIIRFSYNVFGHFSPQWAFLPAGLLALLIFRARLRSLGRFIKDFYLDKSEMLRRGFGGRRGWVAAALALVALFVPVWPENASGRFLLEPTQRAVIRAPVAGQVRQVLGDEGMSVATGTPLLRLESLQLQQEANKAQAELSSADVDLRQAQSSHTGLGDARAERTADLERYRAVDAQVAALLISSPINGTLVTPEFRNLAGLFVSEGSELAEVDNLKILSARIFVPEFEIHKVVPGAAASLKLESVFWPIRGKVSAIAPVSSEIAPGLISQEKYKGSASPTYYVAVVMVENPGELRPGMSGDAKIRLDRRSIAGLIGQAVVEFARRKLW
jgi:multidrug efflux pump subunit AcrA (membrane-fusion protein)